MRKNSSHKSGQPARLLEGGSTGDQFERFSQPDSETSITATRPTKQQQAGDNGRRGPARKGEPKIGTPEWVELMKKRAEEREAEARLRESGR